MSITITVIWKILSTIYALLTRVARTVWLEFFVRYDPDWATIAPVDPERVNTE
jgi:hypothetical protein